MGWKRVSGEAGDIQKWVEGLVVVGTYLEQKENKFGGLIVVSTEDGSKTYGLPKVLAGKLAKVEIGSLVRIECTGKATGESGTEYWTFELDVADGEEPRPPTPEPASARPDPENLPF